jgi:hypothetical protein
LNDIELHMGICRNRMANGHVWGGKQARRIIIEAHAQTEKPNHYYGLFIENLKSLSKSK